MATPPATARGTLGRERASLPTPRGAWAALYPAWQGLALCAIIAVLASLIGHLVPLLGAAVSAILIGILVRQAIGLPAVYAPGVRLAGRRVLQVAIVLLGTGLSLSQVWATSSGSLLVLLGTLAIGLPLMLAIGKLLGIDRTLTRLISVGTGICGASAIGALAPVLGAEECAIAYAISTVFLFNVAAVLSFPPLGHLLGLSQHGFGLWAGTAVNDTSSVVAAGYTFGATAGVYAVVVKLTRTVLIVPLSLIFAALDAREQRHRHGADAEQALHAGLPMFILWFLAACALNTLGVFQPLGTHTLPSAGQFLIVVALASIGLSADPRAMARAGFRPILLGLLGWLCLAGLSLLLQHVSGLQ